MDKPQTATARETGRTSQKPAPQGASRRAAHRREPPPGDFPYRGARAAFGPAFFKDFRCVELRGTDVADALGRPILRDLLVTEIGYWTHAAWHRIHRPQGSADHILHYCIDGLGWCEAGGRRWTIPPDTVMLIPAGVAHAYGVDQAPWSIYWIHFQGRMAGELCDLLGVRSDRPLFRLTRTPEILSLFERVYQFMNSARTPRQLVAASGALSHLLTLANLHRYSNNAQSRTVEHQVQKTIQFMKENLSGRHSLQELAQLAHMSPNHYGKVFKARYGLSPIEYFTRLKIQKACELLTGTDLQVQQLAHNFGFDDPYYFSRLFRRTIGVSPAKYRKSLAKR